MKQVREQGVSVIEVMIGVSVIAVMVVVVGYSVIAYVTARSHLLTDLKAMYLAEEGYEIVRALRDEDWDDLDSLSTSDTHYLDVATTTLAFSATLEIIDTDFRRSFRVTEVYRDGNDDLASSTTPGATVDPESLEVAVSVASPNGTTTYQAILSNIKAI